MDKTRLYVSPNHALKSTMRWRLASGCAAAAVAVAAGCADPPTLESGEKWELAEPAVASIGSGVAPETPLHEVSAAVGLSDGMLVVADGGLGSSRISLFTKAGAFLRTLGTAGDGPGEYRRITSLQRGLNDSILVFDAGWQRLTVLAGDGSVGRTHTFRPSAGSNGPPSLSIIRQLADGSWLGRGQDSPLRGPPGVIRRDTVPVGRVGPTLRTFEVFAMLPSVMSTTYLRGGRSILTLPLFSPQLLVDGWGDCLFFSTGEGSKVFAYSSSGVLIKTISAPGRERPVLDEHVDALLRSRLRNFRQLDRGVIESGIQNTARTEHLPSFHQMVIDQWGHVWVQTYEPPLGWGPHWYIMSQGGELVGELDMPRAARVFQITEDGVLAQSFGEYGEHVVELYRFQTQPAPSSPLEQCVD